MMTVVMEQLGPVCEQCIVHCKSIAAFTTGCFSQGLHLGALVHQFIVTKDPSVMVSIYRLCIS